MAGRNTKESLDRERGYFLPRAESRSEKQWKARGGSGKQFLYAECCRYGVNTIAHAVLEYKDRNHTAPLAEALYQTAARIRNETAENLRDPMWENWLYGKTIKERGKYYDAGQTNWLRDIIKKHEGYWNDVYPNVLERFDALFEGLKSGRLDVQQYYGTSQQVEVTQEGGHRKIEKFYVGGKTERFLLARMEHGSWDEDTYLGSEVILHHVEAYHDSDKVFVLMEEPLQRLVHWNGKNEEDFWQDVGSYAQLMFHAAPLLKGSQTATMMVLAGVTKASGFEMVPRSVPTDHFIEAELVPTLEYSRKYIENFEHPPQRLYTPEDIKNIEMDKNFFKTIQSAARLQGRG